MDPIELGRVRIGPGLPTVIIAEAACEHLGSLERAKRLVDAARDAGADVIKFQLHLPEEMIAGSIQFWGGSMDEVLERWNLGPEAQAEMLAYCDAAGIQYLCTPFSAAAGEILDRLGAPGFKTGSGELTNIPMQRTLARTGRPMIVSTGMATVEEIDETVAVLKEEGARFMLTHCTSAYPPRYEDLNLGYIPVMAERYGVMVGYSDHTPEIYSSLAAVALGAPLLEKHFTLDRADGGPDAHVSLEPGDLRELVDAVRKLEVSLGTEKVVHADEEEVRAWAHHSVVTVRAVPAGEPIVADAVAVKRPGSGIPSRHLEELYGRVAARDIPADTPLQWSDLA